MTPDEVYNEREQTGSQSKFSQKIAKVSSVILEIYLPCFQCIQRGQQTPAVMKT